MGGEYLPTAVHHEVEIARIAIASTTSDVTSLYARPVGRRIVYRMVDEYGGSSLEGRTTRTSIRPLTMGQLIKFFLGAWDLYVCLDCNFEGDLERMLDFFSGESEFYPCFDAALRDLVRQRFPDEILNESFHARVANDPGRHHIPAIRTLRFLVFRPSRPAPSGISCLTD